MDDTPEVSGQNAVTCIRESMPMFFRKVLCVTGPRQATPSPATRRRKLKSTSAVRSADPGQDRTSWSRWPLKP